MSIKLAIGAIAAVVIGAGALVLQLEGSGPRDPPTTEAPREETPDRHARPLVEAPRRAPVTAPITGSAPSIAPAPPAAEPGEPTEREIRDSYARIFDHAEALTPWSRTAVQRARERLPGAVPPGSEVVEVECRGELCRLESRHRDLASFEQYVEAVFFQARTQLWNGGFYAHLDDPLEGGGARRAVAFLAADGKALPPP
jgi:hypothetical protein